MTKKLISIGILSIWLLCCMAAPAFAEDENLLTQEQSGFECNYVPAGWSAIMYSPDIYISYDQAHSGQASVCQTGRTGNHWYSPQFELYPLLQEQGAGEYELSAWIYVDNGEVSYTTFQGRLLVRCQNASYSFITEMQTKLCTVGVANISNRKWIELKGTIVIQKRDLRYNNDSFQLCVDNMQAASLYIDDVTVKYIGPVPAQTTSSRTVPAKTDDPNATATPIWSEEPYYQLYNGAAYEGLFDTFFWGDKIIAALIASGFAIYLLRKKHRT